MNEWIPIDERVPERETTFDAWHRGSRLSNCGGYFGHWTDHDIRENMRIKEYTHWMPLPEPPEERK